MPGQKHIIDRLKTVAAMTMTKAELKSLEPRIMLKYESRTTNSTGLWRPSHGLQASPRATAYIENSLKPMTTVLRTFLQQKAPPLTAYATKKSASI